MYKYSFILTNQCCGKATLMSIVVVIKQSFLEYNPPLLIAFLRKIQ